MQIHFSISEQLERCEGALDTINTDMKEAEDHLKGMEKCCGLCVLPWNKTDDFEKNSEYAKAWKKDDDGGVISDQPRITVGDPTMVPQGGYITKWVIFRENFIAKLLSCRITNDAREDEMDENIQQVSTMVGNLRNMAIDMSTEVSNQNRQLDRIHDKVRKHNTLKVRMRGMSFSASPSLGKSGRSLESLYLEDRKCYQKVVNIKNDLQDN